MDVARAARSDRQPAALAAGRRLRRGLRGPPRHPAVRAQRADPRPPQARRPREPRELPARSARSRRWPLRVLGRRHQEGPRRRSALALHGGPRRPREGPRLRGDPHQRSLRRRRVADALGPDPEPRAQLPIAAGAAERPRTAKRTFGWVLPSLRTLRFERIHQPARLVRPGGRAALRFAAPEAVRQRIERYLARAARPRLPAHRCAADRESSVGCRLDPGPPQSSGCKRQDLDATGQRDDDLAVDRAAGRAPHLSSRTLGARSFVASPFVRAERAAGRRAPARAGARPRERNAGPAVGAAVCRRGRGRGTARVDAARRRRIRFARPDYRGSGRARARPAAEGRCRW